MRKLAFKKCWIYQQFMAGMMGQAHGHSLISCHLSAKFASTCIKLLMSRHKPRNATYFCWFQDGTPWCGILCIDMKIREVGPISFTQKYATKKLLKGTQIIIALLVVLC